MAGIFNSVPVFARLTFCFLFWGPWKGQRGFSICGTRLAQPQDLKAIWVKTAIRLSAIGANKSQLLFIILLDKGGENMGISMTFFLLICGLLGSWGQVLESHVHLVTSLCKSLTADSAPILSGFFFISLVAPLSHGAMGIFLSSSPVPAPQSNGELGCP